MEKIRETPLPNPECPHGYPHSQLEHIFGALTLSKLHYYMRGSTQAICDGRRYDYDKEKYYDTECKNNPHGTVMYPWDVRSFLAGRPVFD